MPDDQTTPYQTPGVYIEESHLAFMNIEEVESDSAAFIGYTEKAEDLTGGSLLLKPKKIRSFAQYQTFFGSEPNFQNGEYYLSRSVQLYFLNGGKTCFIVSVGSYAEDVTENKILEGLTTLESETKVATLVVPDAVTLPFSTQINVYKTLLQHAKTFKRFSILDIKQTETWRQDIFDFRTGIGTQNLSFGAVYHPWLITNDDLQVPSSGALAGIYALNDSNKGVWKPPANISINGIKGLGYVLSQSEIEFQNIDKTEGKSVNSLVQFTGRGQLVWGARTLKGNDNEWRYIPVRRFCNVVELSARNFLEKLVNESNDAQTWAFIKQQVEIFLFQFWTRDALKGTKPEKAYFVSVGLGKTMTQQDILDGNLNVLVGIAPIRPAEFILLKFSQKMAT